MSLTKRLLIVDDDPAIFELIGVMLQQDNWTIETALDGESALAKMLVNPPDLVLTDILMPGIDGLALLRRIHEVQPEARVVVMTVKNTADHVVGSLRGQAFSYLSKPFTRESLIETINAALVTPVAPDDIEVLSDRPGWISLQLRCKLATADRLTQFFRELSADLNPDERDSIATAFRELLMNAIEHGGHLDPNQKVNLTYIRTARSIIYYIRDPGEGFNMDKLPHAAISNSPEAPFEHAEIRQKQGIRPGGFGLLLTRNFADELIYSQKGNEVLLVKYL